MSPTVLHLCSSLGMYGAENALLSLACEMMSAEYHPIIGVFENSGNPHTELAAEAERSGIPTVVFPCAGRLDFRAVLLIRNCIAARRVSILHSHGYKSNIYGLLATLRARTRRVTTCHNWTNANRRLKAYSWMDKQLLRRFDRIVTVSDRISAELIGRGIPQQKIVRISNGVRVERFGDRGGRDELRREFGILPHFNVVGTVGRLSSEKGLPFFLRAAEAVLKNCPETVFLIVGDGPMKEALVRLSASMNLEKNVIFTGLRNDIERIYPVMDIFVLPSLDEGLPMVLLEAMASRRPVVATRVGAIPDVVADGATGLLVPPGEAGALAEAIGSLLRDRERRLHFGRAGYDRVVSRFSARAMAEGYLAIYRSLSNGTSPARGDRPRGAG